MKLNPTRLTRTGRAFARYAWRHDLAVEVADELTSLRAGYPDMDDWVFSKYVEVTVEEALTRAGRP